MGRGKRLEYGPAYPAAYGNLLFSDFPSVSLEKRGTRTGFFMDHGDRRETDFLRLFSGIRNHFSVGDSAQIPH